MRSVTKDGRKRVMKLGIKSPTMYHDKGLDPLLPTIFHIFTLHEVAGSVVTPSSSCTKRKRSDNFIDFITLDPATSRGGDGGGSFWAR